MKYEKIILEELHALLAVEVLEYFDSSLLSGDNESRSRDKQNWILRISDLIKREDKNNAEN